MGMKRSVKGMRRKCRVVKMELEGFDFKLISYFVFVSLLRERAKGVRDFHHSIVSSSMQK